MSNSQAKQRPFPQIASLTSVLLVFCLSVSAAIAALTFPALTGRVVDEAGILDAGSRAALTQKLADLEAKSTDQLVVVTLKSLQGTSIEDFGVQLGRHWQVGQKGKNNGALLIVAPNERKVRIEVGYGLEGVLTDAITRLIIENSILPRFKANDYPGGIARGVDDIISAITDNDEWKQRAAKRPENVSNTVGLVTFLLFFGVFGFIVLVIARDIARRPATPGRRGSSVWGTPTWSSGSSGWSSGGWSSGSSGGGFSGGGGSFGGGGSSGSW
jgi:uncharacterized protein